MLFAHARNWKMYFGRQLRPFIGGRVLEVGAGLGETTRVLMRPDILSWSCLEPDPGMADLLRGKIMRAELPAACLALEGTVHSLRAGTSFDSILYIDVLEHIEDDRKELISAAQLLAPGGHLTVLSPAYQWLYGAFDRAIGHFRRYTRKTLREVWPAGGRVCFDRYLDSVGCLLSLGNHLLRQSYPTLGQIRFWDRAVIPCSRAVDPFIGYSAGRSIVQVWRKDGGVR